jgi:hypothetical protein
MSTPSLSHILGPSHPPPYDTAYISAEPARAAAHAGPPAAPSSGHHDPPLPAYPAQPGPFPAVLPAANLQPPSPATVNGSQANHNGKNLYACRDCGRSYSRPEHLVRHVQTHTLGRRFTCDICQKSFARKDLLRRHVANHENDSPSKRRRLASSPAAGRVSQACRPCATARVKCDDTKPCRRCINRKMSCVSEAAPSSAMHFPQSSTNDTPAAASISITSTVSSSPESNDRSQSTLTEPPTSWSSTVMANPYPISAPHRQQNYGTAPDTAKEQPQSASVPAATSPPPLTREADSENNFASIEPEVASDSETLAFHDFLREVLYDQPPVPAKPSESQGLAVLDFCDNTNLDLDYIEFGLLGNWNMDGLADMVPAACEQSPGSEQPADISQMRQSLVRVWTDSPWRWDPKSHDSGYREQGNLPLAAVDAADAQRQANAYRIERVVQETLDQSGRDQVLAIVLGTCRENTTLDRVAASFPSADLMDMLIHVFLTSHACQVSEWIHFPSFRLNAQWPEWLAVAAAAGAVLMPALTIRKFGFALQEALRKLE